jgi:hypothetical protein
MVRGPPNAAQLFRSRRHHPRRSIKEEEEAERFLSEAKAEATALNAGFYALMRSFQVKKVSKV